jgi:kynurenine formamidase
MIYDISPAVNESLSVWPGDIPYKRTVRMDLDQGDHLTLSHIETTLHLGVHADALAIPSKEENLSVSNLCIPILASVKSFRSKI